MFLVQKVALAPLRPSKQQSVRSHELQGFNDGNFIEWCAQQVEWCLRELWLYQLERRQWRKERWVCFARAVTLSQALYGILAQSHRDITEMVSTEHKKQKTVNCEYLRKVLQNVVFLARQGLPFRSNWVPAEKKGEAGTEVDSNLHQLLPLRTQHDQSILKVMHKKRR